MPSGADCCSTAGVSQCLVVRVWHCQSMKAEFVSRCGLEGLACPELSVPSDRNPSSSQTPDAKGPEAKVRVTPVVCCATEGVGVNKSEKHRMNLSGS